MKIRVSFLALFALAIMASPAMAESRGDNWGHHATDSDTASSNGMHKRMDHDRASSRKDRYREGIWREGDNENASAQRHAKKKKRGKGSSGGNNSSGSTGRSLND
jgi:Ni/Co efflux regulator RcnB